MMARGWSLEAASVSDRGRVRTQNEDSLAVDARLGYAVLADGMGGCNAGEVASRIAVEAVDRGMRVLSGGRALERMAPPLVERAVAEQVIGANEAIYREAQAETAHAGMGTTLVMAVWTGPSVIIAHVGDSRAYRMRDAALEQVTKDHSLLQEQIDRGLIDARQAKFAPHRAIVTRALGVYADVEVEVHTYRAEPGDVYLLCSDGLSEMLDGQDIAATLRERDGNLSRMAESLVRQANDNGGRDNISVILARLQGPGGPA